MSKFKELVRHQVKLLNTQWRFAMWQVHTHSPCLYQCDSLVDTPLAAAALCSMLGVVCLPPWHAQEQRAPHYRSMRFMKVGIGAFIGWWCMYAQPLGDSKA